MAQLIRYLLLANIFIIVLSLFFRLVLEKEKWFRINRFVLFTGLLLALLIPLWQIDFVSSPEQALIVISEGFNAMKDFRPDFILDEVQIYGTAPKVFPWLGIFQIFYLLGIIGMGILFTWKISQIKNIQRSNPMVWINDLFVTLLPGSFSPFSFLGVAYFPKPLNPKDETTALILMHEKAHIKQRHSIDMLFVEIVKILFFYNPAVYTIQKQMALTHEYLADSECAAENGNSYSLALFRSFFQSPDLSFSNGFRSHSMLKRRLLMLEQNNSNKWVGIKYSLFVPLVGIFLTLSAFTLVIP
jgi:bla regulator protein BlaR1